MAETNRNKKIYDEYRKGNTSYNKLAKKYNLTPQRISAIVSSVRKSIIAAGLETSATKQSREEYKNAGVEIREAGDYEKSIEIFDKVIAWDIKNKNESGHVDVLGHKKIALQLIADRTKNETKKREQLKEVEKVANEALTLAVKYFGEESGRVAIQRVHTASLLNKIKKHQEALKQINKALKNFPGSEAHKAWALGIRAMTEYEMGEPEKALKTLHTAQDKLYEGYEAEVKGKDQAELKLRVWNSGIMLGYAKIYSETKRPILAEVYAQAVLETPDPENVLFTRKKQAQEILDKIK